MCTPVTWSSSHEYVLESLFSHYSKLASDHGESEYTLRGFDSAETIKGLSDLASDVSVSPTTIHTPSARRPSPGTLPVSLRAGLLCSSKTYRFLIETYLERLYPLNPIVHRPSFVADLKNKRQNNDAGFLALTIAICAYTLSALPRSFADSVAIDALLPYETGREMYLQCLEILAAVEARYPVDSKTISLNHFCVDYLLYQSETIQDDHVSATVHLHRSIGVLKALRAHLPDGFDRLSVIETELRKRAVWTSYCALSTECLWTTELNGQTRGDGLHFDHNAMMPAEVDDEYITDDEILPQPSGRVSLMTAFLDRIHLFQAINRSRLEEVPPQEESDLFHEELTVDQKAAKENLKRLNEEIRRAEVTLVRIQSTTLSMEVMPWVGFPRDTSARRRSAWYSIDSITRCRQMAGQRADLLITKNWAQTALIEYYLATRAELLKLQSLHYTLVPVKSSFTLDTWNEKLSIAQGLIQKIGNISFESLEACSHSAILRLRFMYFSGVGHNSTQRPQAFNNQWRDVLRKTMSTITKLEKIRNPVLPQRATNFQLYSIKSYDV